MLCEWENLQDWQCVKYLLSPQYVDGYQTNKTSVLLSEQMGLMQTTVL